MRIIAHFSSRDTVILDCSSSGYLSLGLRPAVVVVVKLGNLHISFDVFCETCEIVVGS